MQSDGNVFFGDVVFIKASRDEDNILDQIYKSKYIFIIMILIHVVICCISFNTHFPEFQIFIIKLLKYLIFICLA